MCLETTTTYSNCRAVRVHLDLCASHIEHTRLQLDNAPCPKFSKFHQNIENTTRCYCKEARSFGRDAGFAVKADCARAASKGYGENGLTWSFEKGPTLGLKKKKDRAREKAKEKEKEKEVEVKMEEDSDEYSKIWADARAAGGFGAANGSSYGTVDEAHRSQTMKDSSYQQSKKVKVEKNGSCRARSFDEDHEMN